MALQQAAREDWRGSEKTRVLVVERDAKSRDELLSRLLSNGFDADGVETPEGALVALTAGGFDVLLTSEQAESSTDARLLDSVGAMGDAPRTILITDDMPGQSGVRRASPAVRTLPRSHTQGELMDAVRQAANTPQGLVATLTGINLIDVLQLLHFSQRTVLLRVMGPVEGCLYFDRGEVVHATYGDARGAQAVRQILQLTSGSVRTEETATSERSLNVPLQMLLLDVMRFEDEQGRGEEGELDAEVSRQSYHAPSLSVIPSALSLVPRIEVIPEVDAACRKVVDESEEIVACAVADIQTSKLIGQYTKNGSAVPADRLALRTIDLLSDSIRFGLSSGEVRPNETLDVQLSSRERLYLARSFGTCRGALLLITRRTTSAGMGRALIGTAAGSIEPIVERVMQSMFGGRGNGAQH